MLFSCFIREASRYAMRAPPFSHNLAWGRPQPSVAWHVGSRPSRLSWRLHGHLGSWRASSRLGATCPPVGFARREPIFFAHTPHFSSHTTTFSLEIASKIGHICLQFCPFAYKFFAKICRQTRLQFLKTGLFTSQRPHFPGFLAEKCPERIKAARPKAAKKDWRGYFMSQLRAIELV